MSTIAKANLALQTVWRTDAPPQDGSEIIVIGNLKEDCGDGEFNVQPFTGSILWDGECWVDWTLLSILPNLDNELTILFWTYVPQFESGPVITAEAHFEEANLLREALAGVAKERDALIEELNEVRKDYEYLESKLNGHNATECVENGTKLPETEEEIEQFIADVDAGKIPTPKAPSPTLMFRLVMQHERIKRLRSALSGLVGSDSIKELQGMRSLFDQMGIPIDDKTSMIKAIDALIETSL